MDWRIGRVPAVFAVCAAIALAVAVWGWWVSFERPRFVERPHSLLWDGASLHLRTTGHQVPAGINQIDENPLIRFAAWNVSCFGQSYAALTAAQLPFLVLLLLSTALIGWRLGGPLAGALSPWIALFAPMTVGLSVHLDDLLPLQSLMCFAAALFAFSDRKKLRWIPVLTVIPVVLAVKISTYSNGLLFLMVFGFCAAGFTLFQWLGSASSKNRQRVFPLNVAIGFAPAFIAGLFASLPISVDYFAAEAANPMYRASGIAENPSNLFAYVAVWWHAMAGHRLALLTLVAIAGAFWGKKLKALIPAAVWLIGPILILSAFNKRHDWYLVCAIPATYVLIATGLAAIPKAKFKIPVIALCMLALYGGWQVFDEGGIEDAYGNLSEAFLRKVEPYTKSPLTPLPDYADLGVLSKSVCGRKGLDVLFADGGGINGVDAFYVWRENPKISIGDLWRGPMTNPANSCLIAKLGYDKTPTTQQLADRYKETAVNADKFSGGIKGRYEKLLPYLDQYRLVIHHYNWAIFVPVSAKLN